jgi:hypothetical protein
LEERHPRCFGFLLRDPVPTRLNIQPHIVERSNVGGASERQTTTRMQAIHDLAYSGAWWTC